LSRLGLSLDYENKNLGSKVLNNLKNISCESENSLRPPEEDLIDSQLHLKNKKHQFQPLRDRSKSRVVFSERDPDYSALSESPEPQILSVAP
jgi:hypothetical protein